MYVSFLQDPAGIFIMTHQRHIVRGWSSWIIPLLWLGGLWEETPVLSKTWMIMIISSVCSWVLEVCEPQVARLIFQRQKAIQNNCVVSVFPSEAHPWTPKWNLDMAVAQYFLLFGFSDKKHPEGKGIVLFENRMFRPKYIYIIYVKLVTYFLNKIRTDISIIQSYIYI